MASKSAWRKRKSSFRLRQSVMSLGRSSLLPKEEKSAVGNFFSSIGSRFSNQFKFLTKEKVPAFSFFENRICSLKRFFKPETHPSQQIFQHVIDGNETAVREYFTERPHALDLPNANGYAGVHLAVLHNQLGILKLLAEFNADLNLKDQEDRSPLHYAVLTGSPDIVQYLLDACVFVTGQDRYNMTPLHLAAETGNVEVAKRLIPHYRNLNLKGDYGRTPLHVAALKNNAGIVNLLMDNSVSPFFVSSGGSYPVHTAAKNGCTDALVALVRAYERRGNLPEILMSLRDREGNFPIHVAVNSGVVETVKACISLGGRLTSKQDEGLTPLHMAASQGNVQILKAMFDFVRKEAESALEVTDVLSRTPLHWATQFDHVEVINYLLAQGAKVNESDFGDNTPLLMAATKGCWNALRALVIGGCDTNIKDNMIRNCIHLLVLSKTVNRDMGPILMDVLSINLRQRLPVVYVDHKKKNDFPHLLKKISKGTSFHDQVPQKNIPSLLDAPDCYGFRPVHYAAKHGHLTALNELIELDCLLNVKSHKKQTPLHIAAQFGRYKSCLTILQASKQAGLKNERDIKGMSAVHLASLCGHAKIVSLLLQKGATLTKDHNANTPLHLAAEKGRVDCMEILMETNRNLLFATNKNGDTALHLAARNGHAQAVVLLLNNDAPVLRNNNNWCFFDEVISSKHKKVAKVIVQHIRWVEILQHFSTVYGTFMVGLVRKLPGVCRMVLDRCVIVDDTSTQSTEHFVEFNFTFLNVPSNFHEFASKHNLKYVPLMPLQEMVDHNRVECLSHELCVEYLRMKWRKYGISLHFLDVGIYLVYLIALTCFVMRNDTLTHYDGPLSRNNTENVTYGTLTYIGLFDNVWYDLNHFTEDAYQFENEYDAADKTIAIFIVFFSLVGMTKEVVWLGLLGLRYMSYQRLLEWIVYTTAFMFFAPFVHSISSHSQWEIGALCVFFSWFTFLVQLHRFDFFGIYVVMFIEIMKTLVQTGLIFSILLMTFGLTFYILMNQEKSTSFSTLSLAMYHTLIFLKEMDTDEIMEKYLDNDTYTVHFGIESLAVFGILIFVLPILLSNLLIGLAVGDIESVKRGARLKRLATQVEFHSRAEKRFPYLEKLTEERYVLYPNTLTNFFKNYYYKLVALVKYMPKESRSEEEACIARRLYHQRQRLLEIGERCDKNIFLMNSLMKQLHMTVEEEIWDEGSIVIEGIGEPEEISNLTSHQLMRAMMGRKQMIHG